MRQGLTFNPHGGAYALMPRMLSLLLAIGMAGMMFIYPKALIHVNHGLLSLVMLGICAGFVHGVGFIPETLAGRILFGPWAAWSLMSLGLWMLLNY